MSAAKMHDDEVDIDVSLVRRLLAAQFRQWSDLPIEPVPSTGTGGPSHPGARSAVSHAAVTESVSIMPCDAAIAART